MIPKYVTDKIFINLRTVRQRSVGKGGVGLEIQPPPHGES